MITFESHGFDYDYPIRIDGGNLLHQLGRVSPEQGGFSAQMATLGQKASAGCVRMDYRTDAAHTINAYWLWTHLEWGTKVLVLDDPDATRSEAGRAGLSEVDRRKKNRRNAKNPLHSAVRCG